MLGRQWRSGIEKINWKRTGDVLKVEGILIYPGTFYGLDGKPTKFSEEVIKEIFESVGENIPLKLTHFSDKYVGYATRLGISEDGKVWFKGYVFDEKAISQIEQHGYDGVSGEFDLEMEDSLVKGGVLTSIAFVPTPAAAQAKVEEAKSIALSRGEEKMEIEIYLEKPTPAEFYKWIEEQLKAKGVADIDKVMDVLKQAIKYPYPYPYPKAKMEQLEKENEEFKQTVEQLKEEAEKYRALWMEIKNKELEKITNELKELGVSEPEKVVEEIEDIERKIAILQKMKETILLSKSKTDEKPDVTDTDSIISRAAAELGMTVDDLEKWIGGE